MKKFVVISPFVRAIKSFQLATSTLVTIVGTRSTWIEHIPKPIVLQVKGNVPISTTDIPDAQGFDSKAFVGGNCA